MRITLNLFLPFSRVKMKILQQVLGQHSIDKILSDHVFASANIELRSKIHGRLNLKVVVVIIFKLHITKNRRLRR